MNFISPVFDSEQEAQEWRSFCSQAPEPKYFKVQADHDISRGVTQTYLVDAGYFQRLRIVLGQNKAEFSGYNLMVAALALAEEDKAQARDFARVEKLHADIIQAWPQDLSKTDYVNNTRVEALCKESGFSVDSFLADIYWAPEKWVWLSGPKTLDLVGMVRVASKPKLAEIVAHVGEARVREALKEIQSRMHPRSTQSDTIQGSQAYGEIRKVYDEHGGGSHYVAVSKAEVATETVNARTRAASAAESTAQFRAESLAQTAVSSGNHASTQRLREALENTWGRTWVETLQKRDLVYKNWSSQS